MKTFFAILFFLSGVKISFAQDTIIIHKDARLDVLQQKLAAQNKRAGMMTANGMYKGFRVQVMSTNVRDDAFKAKADLLAKYPDQKVYVSFISPSFKVRIGNFINREDAETLRTELNKLFPKGCYIVEDAIEYTPKEEVVNSQ
jgi:hypothetical protein